MTADRIYAFEYSVLMRELYKKMTSRGHTIDISYMHYLHPTPRLVGIILRSAFAETEGLVKGSSQPYGFEEQLSSKIATSETMNMGATAMPPPVSTLEFPKAFASSFGRLGESSLLNGDYQGPSGRTFLL